jgi:hypothetical protein
MSNVGPAQFSFGPGISPAQGTVSGSDQDAALAQVGFFANTLLSFSWRDIGLPYTDVKVVLRQDLAIHKFSDLDGADVEPTGRGPIEITAKVPFLNHIAAAPSETWVSGDNFPSQFQKFWAAVIDRSPAYLQHPIFGPVYCVVSHAEVDLKATTRDGVYVDVTWIETFEPSGGVSPNVQGGGQLSAATQAGVDLDTLLPTLPASAFPQLPKQNFSFAQFARNLQGVANQVSLLEYQTVGKLDAVISQVQTTLAAFSGLAKGPFASGQSVLQWPTRDAADRFLSSLNSIRQSLLATGQQTSIYVPKQDTSLVMCAQTIPAPIGDLMNLNPSLLSDIVVPQFTQVRYYANTASSLVNPLARAAAGVTGTGQGF